MRDWRKHEVKIKPIETPRLTLRGFTKEDAIWAYSIWNDPEMGRSEERRVGKEC